MANPYRGWFPIFTANIAEPHGLILVTNNIRALNAHGKKSHVWLTTMIHESTDEPGTFTCFPEPFDPYTARPVLYLTHWRPALPEEWPQPSVSAKTGSAANARAIGDESVSG